jgi:hypothetical protein
MAIAHARLHTHAHTRTHTHAYTHAPTHTYIHAHTPPSALTFMYDDGVGGRLRAAAHFHGWSDEPRREEPKNAFLRTETLIQGRVLD